jgi:hypothetical protein
MKIKAPAKGLREFMVGRWVEEKNEAESSCASI